ncbi:hypothetical protein AGMMS49944_15810 [Spirochaetia bacterium]|nr:hypothetical protein AGMMS49944_15810 [Spirochaetia bacterium]
MKPKGEQICKSAVLQEFFLYAKFLPKDLAYENFLPIVIFALPLYLYNSLYYKELHEKGKRIMKI